MYVVMNCRMLPFCSYVSMLTCDLLDTSGHEDVSIGQVLVDCGLAAYDVTLGLSSATSESNMSLDSDARACGGVDAPRYYPG